MICRTRQKERLTNQAKMDLRSFMEAYKTYYEDHPELLKHVTYNGFKEAKEAAEEEAVKFCYHMQNKAEGEADQVKTDLTSLIEASWANWKAAQEVDIRCDDPQRCFGRQENTEEETSELTRMNKRSYEVMPKAKAAGEEGLGLVSSVEEMLKAAKRSPKKPTEAAIGQAYRKPVPW